MVKKRRTGAETVPRRQNACAKGALTLDICSYTAFTRLKPRSVIKIRTCVTVLFKIINA